MAFQLPFFKGKKIRRRSYKKDKFRFSSINWLRIVLLLGAAMGIALSVFIGIRIVNNYQNLEKLPEYVKNTPGPIKDAQATKEPVKADGKTQETAFDMSGDVVKLKTKEKRINTPSIFGDELVYSAGTGSLDLPVLQDLYTYDLFTDEEKRITGAVVKNGEIYETVMNENWIVWLDTDQQGTNLIYCIDRNDLARGPIPIKECTYTVPKLRLSQDVLLFSEQNEEREERLYIVDLVTGEDLSIMDFTESIRALPDNYGVSSPDIYGNLIIWAAPNPKQSQEDLLKNGEKSIIYTLDLAHIGDDVYEPSYFDPEMYVHEPVTNGSAYAWIDRNKAPDSKLYLKVENEIKLIAENVTTYALGTGFLAYGNNSQIFIYDYEKGVYGRITAPGKHGILPVVSGKRVVFFDLDASGKDVIKSVVLH